MERAKPIIGDKLNLATTAEELLPPWYPFRGGCS